MFALTQRIVTAAALAASILAVVRPAVAGAQRAPVARPASASAGVTRLDRVMAPWELEATGVARLSAAERRALEAWLTRYTETLRGGRVGTRGSGAAAAPSAPAASDAPAGMDTIRPAPGSRPAPEPSAAPPRAVRIAVGFDPVPSTLQVAVVYDGGDVIATSDGNLWETYLPDRFNAAAWRAGQSLVARSNPLPHQLSGPPFDVILVNGETRTTAAARYAGRRLVDPADPAADGSTPPGGVPITP